METLLKVDKLKQYYPIKGGVLERTVNHVKAVDDISFTLAEGETLSIVGESGCGKSTIGRAILRLVKSTTGKIEFLNKDLLKANAKELREMRKNLQVIFQDPFASLNPRQKVGSILEEALIIHKKGSKSERKQRIIELLESVGLSEHAINRYPHEFSGGQRQRIGIARALSVEPRLIICDEAVSALDVSVQAQVLNLLKTLQKKHKLAYLFISHDLGVVKHVSDRVIVMYLGKIVEIGDKTDIFKNPKHPYTKALLSAIPSTSSAEKQKRIVLKGDIPSPIDPPVGCRFHTRCPFATSECKTLEPELKKVGVNQSAACHLI
ncbi:ABC transporter ATP-binding protein [Niallia sp. NCCP-28]|uniref:ABC transporter ATP-binding protein n=1 Tax=Niallia sp. NCCP-28 TaxID=2934712 RepID=UPI00208181C6|nr:dipeptide ABC transporter ATP-binding protein [Niallia sp. NCCP-28]GKU85074.1 peptide ABC transporter ATP-binding protein [Niallia sp. NCCP-28]